MTQPMDCIGKRGTRGNTNIKLPTGGGTFLRIYDVPNSAKGCFSDSRYCQSIKRLLLPPVLLASHLGIFEMQSQSRNNFLTRKYQQILTL